MKVSNCCGALFYEPGWPDNDICSDCREHADSVEYEYPRSTNLIQQRLDRDEYKHGWRKKMKVSESEEADKRAVEKVRRMTNAE